MKKITSRENPIYKSVCKLTRRKYRDQSGRYLLEGIKPLTDALDIGIPIEMILRREGRHAGGVHLDEDVTVELGAKLFDAISDTEHSQGIIAVARKLQYDWESFGRLFQSNTKNIVVLDRLQDPGNLGTIIRTAEAAGYGGILLMNGCADAYAPKVVRAAAGSLLRMPILEEDDVARAAGHLHDLQRHIVVTSLDAEQYYNAVDLSKSTALIIGNEGSGVCPEFLRAADAKIKIPMSGSIESLNAAVAAGILMYQTHNTD